MKLRILILILTVNCQKIFSDDIKLNDIEVVGPGLKPDLIVMPARYFYVYFRGRNYTGDETIDVKDFKVVFKGDSLGRDCHVWSNILDRKDSSVIVRYKMYQACENFLINIFYKNKHIPGSPFYTKGPVLNDDCPCPEPDIEKWLENYECQSSYNQMEYDLSRFGPISSNDYYEKGIKRFKNSHSTSVCHYVVKNNNVYRNCYGQHVGFKMFYDALLLSLTRKVVLPDFELFMNLGDWPLVKKTEKEIFPLFSWCGSKETSDIVIPTYDLTDSALENMGRISVDMLSVQGNIEKRWDEKEEKGFWRGRDSNEGRLSLVKIARENPELFNASLTNFFFFKDRIEEFGPKVKHISFFKFFDYKYQINVDGTVAAYRFPFLLAGDSLVFKQNSHYYEYFYGEIEPWVHYVPVKLDLSDLIEKVKWAKENDQKAKAIALAGRKFAVENLLPQDIFCYHTTLLNKWSKKFKSVNVRDEMEHVKQNPDQKCPCSKTQKDEL